MPQQRNGYDCGVYVAMVAYCIIHDFKIDDKLAQNIESVGRLFMSHKILLGKSPYARFVRGAMKNVSLR